MSADSLRKGMTKISIGKIVRPQAVSERTLMESVAGLINEVGLVTQPHSTSEEKESKVLWTRIERNPNFNDLKSTLLNNDASYASGDSSSSSSSSSPHYNHVNNHHHNSHSQRQQLLLSSSLYITLGYASGVQMWTIPVNGEAQEILSWRRPGVRFLRLLPTPPIPPCSSSSSNQLNNQHINNHHHYNNSSSSSSSSSEKDSYRVSRPIVVVCEGGNSSPSCTNVLSFISLRTGDVMKSSKFTHPVSDVQANLLVVVVSFAEKIVILDAYKFDVITTIKSSASSSPDGPLLSTNAMMMMNSSSSLSPPVSPIAIGSSWLAFADRKVHPGIQSAGGVEVAGAPSYTATVLYAAKSLTKGLKGLGETVANSIAGHRIPTTSNTTDSNSTLEPGVVTIINLSELKPCQEFSFSEMYVGGNNSSSPISSPSSNTNNSCSSPSLSPSSSPSSSSSSSSSSHSSCIIAHFIAHHQYPVLAMSFDSSGLLLVTADRTGHDFNVFRIHPHPLGSSMGAVHHLYVLHRGDTGAKVQDISFAPDSRWVAVSTMRGTTHIFPITPYGGAISVRTHTSHRVVNRLSRFHRTAGLDDAPTSGRNSPIMSFSPSSSSNSLSSGGGKPLDLYHLGSPYPNPRLPPFPHPVVISPLGQLRQSYVVNSMSNSPRNSPPTCKSKGGSSLPYDERVHVNCLFEVPRGWLHCSPAIVPSSCDKRKRSPVDALFVLTSHGNLIEYSLEPLAHSGVPKDKVSDDTQIELSVHATAQWKFTKPSFSKDLQPPLQPNNVVLVSNSTITNSTCSNNTNNGHSNNNSYNSLEMQHLNSYDSLNLGGGGGGEDDGTDDRWLSQVEISTHAGPHRRLWMGPQFTFKVFNSVSSSKNQSGGLIDVETVEVNVTNRPAKSKPVNMPVSSSLLPQVIAGSSGSSLEQSPRLNDAYCDSENAVTSESLKEIKENLAEAMMENCSISRENGGCQSLGSCDDDLSSSSFDLAGQNSIDPSLAPTFCIDASFPE